MKTGLGRHIGCRVTTGIALTAAVALPLLLSGCEDHSPVAAPTSTLPAGGSTDDPTGGKTNTSLPDYETELNLNADEKQAVEGALAALDGYVATLNRVFSSGGDDTNEMDKFAQGDALKALSDDSAELEDNSQYMAGEFELANRIIETIDSNRKLVTVLSCVDNSAFAQVESGRQLPKAEPQPLTVEFVAEFNHETWKVDSQDLRSEQCEY